MILGRHAGYQIFADDVTLGSDATKLVTVYASTVEWKSDPTHSGIHTFSSSQMFIGSDALASTLQLNLNAAAGNFRDIHWRTGGSLRWTLRVTNDAETGSNAGSNFQFIRRDDAGAILATPLSITRSTGTVTAQGTWTFNDGVVLGNAATDALTIASSTVSWSNNPTHSGNHIFTGSLQLISTNALGYGTGSGGTVTQTNSKSTAVVLNKPSGQITMNNSSLAAGSTVNFLFTNSTITANDLLILNHISTGTAGAYGLNAQCSSGSFAAINVRNNTATALAEAIVLAYGVFKGAAS